MPDESLTASYLLNTTQNPQEQSSGALILVFLVQWGHSGGLSELQTQADHR